MEWNASDIDRPTAPSDISNYDAKEKVARQMTDRLHDGDVVGVGSGSTSMLALHALVDQAHTNGWNFSAITTSLEIEIACAELGVKTSSLVKNAPIGHLTVPTRSTGSST